MHNLRLKNSSSYWLLVIGYWLLVIGYWLFTTNAPMPHAPFPIPFTSFEVSSPTHKKVANYPP